VQGRNLISVSYKDQTKILEVLRQNPFSKGSISTQLQLNDVLNTKPAPGVPNYINFTLQNSYINNFPAEKDEYIQIKLKYVTHDLILQNKYYSENDFIQNNQLDFEIPVFLQTQDMNLQLEYSGNTFLEKTAKTIPITIHDYTPVITTIPNTYVLDKSGVLNDTTSFVSIKIEGYLPIDLQVEILLTNESTTHLLKKENITYYRQTVYFAVANQIPSGKWILEEVFTNGDIRGYDVQVVERIDMSIRTDKEIITLDTPIQFNLFCFDPITFSGVSCVIKMLNGTIELFSIQTAYGHIQKTLTFSKLNTAKEHKFIFKIIPTQGILSENTIDYKARFYHNTTIDVVLQKNIVEKKQLLSLKADTNGKFYVKNENKLIINTYSYESAGIYANYFLTLNKTFRGINTLKILFVPFGEQYSNVSLNYEVFIYEKIIIQKVGTNATFYQLGSNILIKGVASIGNDLDSLNGVRVSLLLKNEIISNTTIQTNEFIFIVDTPNTTGLKKYQLAIYGNEKEFIVTSSVYEFTVSVINNFGIYFEDKDYQVGDTLSISITGQEQREYSLYYYNDNGDKIVLKDFMYSQSIEYDFVLPTFGMYTIYLEEKATGDYSYYAVTVLQNPKVQLEYGIMEIYIDNILNVSIHNYDGNLRYKIDNLYQKTDKYVMNGSGKFDIIVYNTEPGNHSLTLEFENNFTLEKVRNYYFIIYQKIDLLNYTYIHNTEILAEEDTLSIHFTFEELNNNSINDIPVQIITNENTILAQANIFNSVSNMELTVIGDKLELVIKENPEKYIYQKKIPLNITIYRLLTSDVKERYSYESESTVKIQFSYKYFPTIDSFEIQYELEKDNTTVVYNKTVGKNLEIKITDNGVYTLKAKASGKNCVNLTIQTNIELKKLFDLSNTDVMTMVGVVGSIPLSIVGISVLKKKKSVI
jgi:hypothetical protein